MREVTASGQSVEEAVQSALEQLDTTRDQVEVDIVDEGKRDFWVFSGPSRQSSE